MVYIVYLFFIIRFISCIFLFYSFFFFFQAEDGIRDYKVTGVQTCALPIYVYSRPEWTALVTRKETGIAKVAELKGKRVAVTRGTDPHIFLVRALAEAGLTEKDVKLVLLQHADGRLALERGDVDAWAGLDPMMASAEIEGGAVLFYRKPEANTWGILNVRESFAHENPEIVKRVLAAYEEARAWALANPDELRKIFIGITKLPDSVVERQLATRTELTHSGIGAP